MEIIAGVLLYLCWEASLLTISILVCKKIIFKNHIAQKYSLVFVLGLKILITSCLMYVLTYFHVIQLLIPITILAFCGILFSLFQSRLKLRTKVSSLLKTKYKIDAIRRTAVLVCISTLAITPLIETDSNFATNWIMKYLNNSGSILEFAWNYSAHWEVNYLPGLYFTNSWLVIFVKNFEVIAIIYVLINRLASNLIPTKKVNDAIVLAVMSLPLFWINVPTGFATLKNDQIYAAGNLMIITALVQLISNKKFNFEELILLILGSILVLVKFSGPLLIVLVALFILNLRRRNRFSIEEFRIDSRRIILIFAPLSIAYILPYLYNLLVYRSPLYPVQLSLFGFNFPGYFNTKDTRIIENLGSSETWLALLGVPMFPYALAGLMFIPIVLLSPMFLFNKSKPTRDMKNHFSTQVTRNLTKITLILILLYFVTPFSSGTKELPIIYLTSQNTLRYIIAPILILTLIALLKVSERFQSTYLINLLCAVFTVSNCITIIKTNNLTMNLFLELSILVFVSFAIFMDLSFINSNRKWMKKLILFVCVFIFVLSANNLLKSLETNFYSVDQFKIQGSIANLVVPIPPQPDLAFVISGYCATGSQFNGVKYVGSIGVDQLMRSSNTPDFLAVCSYPWQRISPEVEGLVSELLMKYGYTFFASTKNRLVYTHDKS